MSTAVSNTTISPLVPTDLPTTPPLDPKPIIATPRLYISHFLPTDPTHIDFTLAVMNNSAANKRVHTNPLLPNDRASSIAYLAAGVERITRTGYGRYCVSLRPSPDPTTSNTPIIINPQSDTVDLSTLIHIGTISCQIARHPQTHPGPAIPDIGFNFLPEYHGRGYANEAATALMQYYRETRRCEAFAGFTDGGNEDSKKCLKRLGFADRGLRKVAGLVDEGREAELSVWTIGLSGGEDELRDLRL
ncbi:GNAT domain-containing protein [Paraphoma chrysanthemicola]|uniref:GNAT domain-containing protein n=1 Tax=Paraphoma chrysanthemicola TaxID=798071 RepID=A0A8K0R7T3_9PLEO|nr:GNAT domain-containing protein [Paraphoma chrysanthemicola]